MKRKRDRAFHIEKRDFLAMGFFTLLFLVVVMFRLGSHTAPETEKILKNIDKQNEVIIDLGEVKYVDTINIFLGYKDDPKLYFSYYNEDEKKWVNVKSEIIDSAFAWNSVKYSTSCRYIGIVSGQKEAILKEIILKDEKDEIITPIIQENNKELFDEQWKFPGKVSYYDMTMFDEVYHGRTAYEFLHNLDIYENTHPPLGKTIISLGIAIFGMNPFGWRFMVAIFGIITIPIIYLFALFLTKETKYACFGTILGCTEFMHYTLSRIATIDIIVAVFILLSFYFIYRFGESLYDGAEFKTLAIELLLCGLSCGLAIATKWTGVYSSAGIAILLFAYLIPYTRRNGGLRANKTLWAKLAIVCVIVFLILPFLIYLFSYFEFKQTNPDKNLFLLMWENAQHMLNYHNGVNAKHPYESRWYQWLLDCKPLLDSWKSVGDGKVSAVSTFGNPVIVWSGLLALLYNMYLCIRKKNRQAMTLIIAYLVMFLPWVVIARTTFIYQYFVCILIMILLIVNAVKNLPRKNKAVMIVIGTLSVVSFIMFFPIISGYPVSYEYLKFLQFIPTWTFV